ncbi:MAG: queuosine precursor transporter [Bacteroidetes bacterium]|nr:queuosine precursor transporter [Bacteroidota bacterium]MBL6962318.1 queuosine precursor transporter [Bacteroidota bacterium]
MVESKKRQAETIYLILGGLFIAALITGNLIFQKFFHWTPFGWYTFELSVGILPYPITFLVTDIISEVYGRKRANRVVIAGLFASLFTLLIIVVANKAPATIWSPVSNEQFTKVFGLTFVAVGSSLLAYLLAQFVDVQLFHFWKRLTKGKHLWLRNNASTINSQLIDTFTVIFLLCTLGAIEWVQFWKLLINGFLFKVIIALLDTPIAYVIIFGIRKNFGLKKPGEELKF